MANPKETQPDKNVAAEERSVPSQAEGDRETVDADLAAQEQKPKKTPGPERG